MVLDLVVFWINFHMHLMLLFLGYLGVVRSEVRIANKQLLTNSTPEVFFSGALHGDERLGPLTVSELAAFLCEEYHNNMEEAWLLSRGEWKIRSKETLGYYIGSACALAFQEHNRPIKYIQIISNSQILIISKNNCYCIYCYSMLF